MRIFLSALVLLTATVSAFAGQAPGAADQPDIAVSGRDRFYTADQFSNTVSVINPTSNKLLGFIRLGDPTPGNLSPLYRGQLLVHGMGFSPDHRTLLVVSIGSNSVSFIDTASNAVKYVTYVGRSPHEAFFTPDGKEVWVSVRGENYIAILDSQTYREKSRIEVPNGPGMTIFSPDGAYGYVCSSFSPETVVIATATKQIVGRVKQESPFCPDIAATPDGKQVWFTLKDVGKVMVFNAQPPFEVIKVLDTGPITNHVNFARTPRGQFAYVTVGGLNLLRVFRTSDFEQVATIETGALPHGLWPSGDGTRIYVGLENASAAAVIDTLANKVIATVAVGEASQGVAYVPDAVPSGEGLDSLQPGSAPAQSIQLRLSPPGGKATTQVTLFDQGLVQFLQAAVTGLEAKQPYVLALATQADGGGKLEPIASFMTNPAGAAIVNTVGPIREVVEVSTPESRRYLVIAPGSPDHQGQAVQVQMP
jgi:YVTN family beta-propeller protein